MLVKVENLRVAFRSEGRLSVPVRGVSFEVPHNSRVALVGESGCGKSLSWMNHMQEGPINLARKRLMQDRG